MAKRMDGTETWFRVYYEVAYTIRYHSFNKAWDHKKPTTGDHEGSNPLYVWYPEETKEDFYIYLGPFNSMKALEREADKFEAHYKDSPESYRDLVITRGQVEEAQWVEV